MTMQAVLSRLKPHFLLQHTFGSHLLSEESQNIISEDLHYQNNLLYLRRDSDNRCVLTNRSYHKVDLTKTKLLE